MKHSLCFFTVAILCICCTPSKTSPPSDAHSLLIHNVNVIDVTNGALTANQDILIDGRHIRAIGQFPELVNDLPAEQQVDATGLYAIPGLWDMHVHIEGADLIEDNLALFPLYIAYGITTVRDAASDLGKQVLVWRDQINRKELFGPRIFTAGRKLEGINSVWKGDLEIANEQEMNQMLDTLVHDKVDFVKITENTLSGDLFLASVKAAKARGFKVTGHVPYDLSIHDLAEAGFSGIEHSSYLMRLGSDDEGIVKRIRAGALTRDEANDLYRENYDPAKAMEGYKYLASKNVVICPTLIGGKQLSYLDENNHQSDAYLQYLTKRFTDNYQWRINRMGNPTAEQIQQRKDTYQRNASQLPHIKEAGMLIMAGSDAAALNTYVYPALALHEELTLFQDAGLDPLSILQSATINGAKFMGAIDSLATLDTGKIADIVLLKANPLEDIAATQQIELVIRGGELFNRKALDSLLQTARDKKVALDAARGN